MFHTTRNCALTFGAFVLAFADVSEIVIAARARPEVITVGVADMGVVGFDTVVWHGGGPIDDVRSAAFC